MQTTDDIPNQSYHEKQDAALQFNYLIPSSGKDIYKRNNTIVLIYYVYYSI